MTKYTKQQSTNAIAQLRKLLKPGDTVHTILRHVSRSGMSRRISVIGKNSQDLTWLVAQAAGYNMAVGNAGLVVGGCGSDMGFEVIYNLGRVLFPDGFKLRKGMRARNGDTSGHDNDGGYALYQRWL